MGSLSFVARTSSPCLSTDRRPQTLPPGSEVLLVDLRLLRLWLLDLVLHDRQDVDCRLVSLDLPLVLEALVPALVHHRSLVARQDMEDHHLALLVEVDPQADRVS